MPKGPCPRCKIRPRNKKSTYCKECGAAKAREAYAKDPEAQRRAHQSWRQQNPDKAKEAKCKYNGSARGQAKRRAYRRSSKGKEIARRYAESDAGKEALKRGEKRYRDKMRGLTANLPVEVVRPFVARMVKVADAEHVSGGIRGARSRSAGGYQELARLVGVSHNVLWDIVNKKTLKSVEIKVADRLAMFGEFTLGELYERAEEWAILTHSNWPEGYYRRQRYKSAKRRRKRDNTKKAVLRLLEEEGPMNQRELADRLRFANTSAVSKCLDPLIAAGQIERFRLPGERRRRYRLVLIRATIPDGKGV